MLIIFNEVTKSGGSDGLAEALSLEDGETLALAERLALDEGETEGLALALSLPEGLTDGLADPEGLRLAEGD